MGITIPFPAISAFCIKWRVVEFALFGSVLREDFRPDSDVDVLLTFEPESPWSLFIWFGCRMSFKFYSAEKLTSWRSKLSAIRSGAMIFLVPIRSYMRRDRRDAAALMDMVNSARGILLKMEGISLEHFISDEDLRLGIERRFEILGEAARRISDDFKANHPQVPWREVVRQRNFISHEYDDIDPVRIRHVSHREKSQNY